MNEWWKVPRDADHRLVLCSMRERSQFDWRVSDVIRMCKSWSPLAEVGPHPGKDEFVFLLIWNLEEKKKEKREDEGGNAFGMPKINNSLVQVKKKIENVEEGWATGQENKRASLYVRAAISVVFGNWVARARCALRTLQLSVSLTPSSLPPQKMLKGKDFCWLLPLIVSDSFTHTHTRKHESTKARPK